MGSGVFDEVWPLAKSTSRNRSTTELHRAAKNSKRNTDLELFKKERLRERITSSVPLSQNGYGDCSTLLNRINPTMTSNQKMKKANSTLRASRAVPHPSTDRAFRRLTSEFGWDRVYSTKYGRWRRHLPRANQNPKCKHHRCINEFETRIAL